MDLELQLESWDLINFLFIYISHNAVGSRDSHQPQKLVLIPTQLRKYHPSCRLSHPLCPLCHPVPSRWPWDNLSSFLPPTTIFLGHFWDSKGTFLLLGKTITRLYYLIILGGVGRWGGGHFKSHFRKTQRWKISWHHSWMWSHGSDCVATRTISKIVIYFVQFGSKMMTLNVLMLHLKHVNCYSTFDFGLGQKGASM